MDISIICDTIWLFLNWYIKTDCNSSGKLNLFLPKSCLFLSEHIFLLEDFCHGIIVGLTY
jgi:hypothetical protein